MDRELQRCHVTYLTILLAGEIVLTKSVFKYVGHNSIHR